MRRQGPLVLGILVPMAPGVDVRLVGRRLRLRADAAARHKRAERQGDGGKPEREVLGHCESDREQRSCHEPVSRGSGNQARLGPGRAMECLKVYHDESAMMVGDTQALAPGTLLLDRYQVLRSLGSGGMASTYLVRDRLWLADIAIKIVSTASHAIVSALRTEFQVLRSLCHPRLCRVYDFGFIRQGAPTRPHYFYTADFVDGSSLAQFAGSAPFSALLGAFCDALEGLAILHAAGIRHGDFKPSNVLVSGSGQGVLIDLGCAQPLSAPRTSLVSGTPRFLAPELLAGGPVDQRADLFAAGVTLSDLIRASRASVPSSIQALATRLASPSPAARPGDVVEVLELLGRPTVVRPVLAAFRADIVGRDSELQTLHAALGRLREGRPGPRALHVVADDGCGRTRLLRELKWLGQQHIRVLEANVAAPEALCSMLSSLYSSPVGQSVAAVLDARDQLKTQEPVLCIIDDAHLLTDPELAILRALLRSATSSDTVGFAVSSTPDLVLEGNCVQRLCLGPLDPASARGWLAPLFSERAVAQALELTGGKPSAITELQNQLAAGTVSPDDLSRACIKADPAIAAAWQALPEPERKAIAVLSLTDSRLSVVDLQALGIEVEVLDRLAEAGWIRRDGFEIAVGRVGARPAVQQSLGHETARAAHGMLADWMGTRMRQLGETADRAELAARRVTHLVRAGRDGEASELLLTHASLHPRRPAGLGSSRRRGRAGEQLPRLAAHGCTPGACGGADPRRASAPRCA